MLNRTGLCSVVALDWVDLTNVAAGIFISSVTGSILIELTAFKGGARHELTT